MLKDAADFNVPVVYEDFIDECIRARKVTPHDSFVIVKGQSREFSKQKAAAASSEKHGLVEAAPAPGSSSAAVRIEASQVFDEVIAPPSDIPYIGFDEVDELFMSSSCHFYEPRMDLELFNQGLRSSDGEGTSITDSFALGMVGFDEPLQTAPDDEVVEERQDPTTASNAKPTWPPLPGQNFSAIAKKYVEEQAEVGSTVRCLGVTRSCASYHVLMLIAAPYP